MKVIRSTQEFREWRLKLSGDVGFVPTMGNLHSGHLSLLETSLKEHQVSVLSIFVNPTQFGPNDDFAKYPRTLERDSNMVSELLKKYPGKECVVFAPQSAEEIYPSGFSTLIKVPALDGFLEGAFRPGHFEGVATVVYLLFSLVKPRTAYFGRKDYQQYRVIKRMARDLELPIRVKGMPIIRDEHGLALSSRNQYLSDEQRKLSLHLIRTLEEGRRRLGASFEQINAVREWMKNEMQNDPRWQYLELREARNLSIQVPKGGKVVLLAVLKVGEVRLLDNLEVQLA